MKELPEMFTLSKEVQALNSVGNIEIRLLDTFRSEKDLDYFQISKMGIQHLENLTNEINFMEIRGCNDEMNSMSRIRRKLSQRRPF